MDPRAAVQRLLELQADGIDADALDAHLDDTAFELLSALCASLSFAVAGVHGPAACGELARDRVGQCVSAINMVLEVWDMGEAQVIGAPYLDEYDTGWLALE